MNPEPVNAYPFSGKRAALVQSHVKRAVIGFKIKILDALSVVNVRRVRLPPSIIHKIIILKPIARTVITKKRGYDKYRNPLSLLVGGRGFEPRTSTV